MKILYLNAADSEGGTSKAATRLLHGIREQGAAAGLFVQRKRGSDPLIEGPGSGFGRLMARVRPTVEETLLGISPARRSGPFCAAFLPDRLLPQINGYAPDILHLHWVARMMRIETLARLKVPIVWTLHDSWAFTGGCYLPLDCTRFRESCGNCPVLGSCEENDLSRRIWNRKRAAWRNLNLMLVAPSRWMAEQARRSSLFGGVRVEVIPNGIDVERYRPFDQGSAREMLSLPRDKKLILFGAKGALDDPNKGFHLLKEALGALATGVPSDGTELVVFGTSAPQQPPDLPFKARYLGWLSDDRTLALLYSAADVFVLPSITESLGYAAMEAMACGTPCVAFRQGGVPDLIEHGMDGYLAHPYEAADLARGIAQVLEDRQQGGLLPARAREKVARGFSVKSVAQRHMELYSSLLNPKD